MRTGKKFYLIKGAEWLGDRVVYETVSSKGFITYTNDEMKNLFGNDIGLPFIEDYQLIPFEIYESPLFKAMKEE